MRALILLLMLLCAAGAQAQSGPWAKYDAKMKGDALLREASGGNLAEVRSIVQGGGDVNWQQPNDGMTALMGAAQGGHADVVAYLLEQGADPYVVWNFMGGMTALDLAKMGGDRDVIALLEGASQGLPPPGVPPPNAGNRPPAPVPAPGPTPAPRPSPVPAPAPPVAAPPAAPSPVAPTSRGGWPPFGTYRVGDRVQWRQSNGWFTGTVSDLGPAAPNGGLQTYERRYRIADDRWSGDGEWWDHGLVAGLEREPFWTGFFVGDWALGEVMAVNDRLEDGEAFAEFAYHSASEALRVHADGFYEWKPLGGDTIHGKWIPAPDGPGIVLQRGVDGADWVLRNETNAIEENIRGLQTARLTTDGKMSIAAKRPMR